MTTDPSIDINQNGTLQNFTEDPATICRRVNAQRVGSLCFSFIAAIFLIYLVTALCIYSYKKKLMIGCRGKKLQPKPKQKERVKLRLVL